MDIKIFEINECDYVAAESKESAIGCYKTITDFDDGDPIRELTNEELEKLKFIDDLYQPTDDVKKTFKDKLDEMISKKESFPVMFATSEF